MTIKVESMAMDRLREHPKNPRVHPESAIHKLIRSIEYYGFTNPILISKDNFILAGHARYKAMERMGYDEVPVIRLDLQGELADAYLIADNRIQDETEWDSSKLKDLLEDLDTGAIDLTLTGFDMDEVENLMISQFEIADLDDILSDLDLSDHTEKPIWATIRTDPKHIEALDKALRILEEIGLRVERSYE